MTQATKILVVDDEESIRFSFRMFLKDQGVVVETASDVDEALARIEREKYEVAVIDRILPGKGGGMEVLRHLNEIQPECKAVLMSAHPSFESAAETLRYNTFAYLTKPVKKEEIRRVVQQAARQGELARYASRQALLFHSLFDSSPNPILIRDLGRRPQFVNSAFTRVFGYTAEDLAEETVSFIPPSDIAQTQTEMRTLLAGDIIPEREECLAGTGINIY